MTSASLPDPSRGDRRPQAVAFDVQKKYKFGLHVTKKYKLSNSRNFLIVRMERNVQSRLAVPSVV